MSQKSNTINFVIHDANGQPRMVKVVQSNSNQSHSQVKLPKSQNPLKIIKLPSASQRVNTQGGPVYRAIKLSGIKCTSKLVTLPVDAFKNTQKIVTKTEPIETEEVQVLEEVTQPEVVQPQIIKLEVSESVPTSTSTAAVQSSQVTVTSSGPGSRPAMSYSSRRRHNSDNDQPAEYTTKRRKHADKVGKGLRHFSMKVCEKVRTKGFTSYNEVADELVAEFAAGIHGSADSQHYDQKNIRRRVYDALNVLMAMNIISKEKKEIRWLGLPTNSIQECTTLEKEKQAKLERIQKKTQQLQELILQHISFKSLIDRNKEAENKGVKPSPSSAIHLPFIVVNTSDKALIDCSISNDKSEYMFNFNKKFQIHDDIDILKRMGLLFGLDKGECSEEGIERAKGMVPKSLQQYVEQMGRGDVSNITDLLDEADAEAEDYEDGEHLETDTEVEAEPETEQENEPEADDAEEADEADDAEGDGNEYSDEDSSDVYV